MDFNLTGLVLEQEASNPPRYSHNPSGLPPTDFTYAILGKLIGLVCSDGSSVMAVQEIFVEEMTAIKNVTPFFTGMYVPTGMSPDRHI
jgi:hypothetical protein